MLSVSKELQCRQRCDHEASEPGGPQLQLRDKLFPHGVQVALFHLDQAGAPHARRDVMEEGLRHGPRQRQHEVGDELGDDRGGVVVAVAVAAAAAVGGGGRF